MSYGATGGAAPSAEVKQLFIKQLEVNGTVLCTRGEADRVLAFCQVYPIVPVIHPRFTLADIHAAYDSLARGEQLGMLVIEIRCAQVGGLVDACPSSGVAYPVPGAGRFEPI